VGTKRKIYTVIIVIVVILLVLLVGAYSLINSLLANNEFFGSAENFVTKVDSPISLEQARKELTFPLPDEATDVYYAHWHQWISYMFKVKFSAPLDVCKSHAIDVIQRFNENHPDRKIPLELTEISDLSVLPKEDTSPSPPLNITWFDVHDIKNGFKIGTIGPMQPMIWIDADRNIFYYEMID